MTKMSVSGHEMTSIRFDFGKFLMLWLSILIAFTAHHCEGRPATSPQDQIEIIGDDDAVVDDEPTQKEVGTIKSLDCKINNKAAKEERFNACIKAAALEYQVRPQLIWAVIKLDSGFNPHPKLTRSGTVGLMQVLPSACSNLDVTHDPKNNISCGTWELASLIKQWGSEKRGLMAHNLGAGVAEQVLDCPSDIPSWATQYADRALALADKRFDSDVHHLLVTRSYVSAGRAADEFCDGRDKSFASPDKSTHTSGNSIDVTLLDVKGMRIDMPRHNLFSKGTHAQKANARALKRAMEAAGFTARLWERGDWSHYEFEAPTPAVWSSKFNCEDWKAKRLAAPSELNELVEHQLNRWSRVKLAPEAIKALRAVEEQFAMGQTEIPSGH